MTELTLRHESWPLAGRFAISRGAKTTAEVVVVELRDGDRIARGECVPYARYGETIESVSVQIESVRDVVESGGRDELQTALAPGAARNALDCALWDLAAKQAGVRVWDHPTQSSTGEYSRIMATSLERWATMNRVRGRLRTRWSSRSAPATDRWRRGFWPTVET